MPTQDCYSQNATMGRELMAPRTDRTTRIPSAVASPVTTNHAAKRSVFVNLPRPGNLKKCSTYCLAPQGHSPIPKQVLILNRVLFHGVPPCWHVCSRARFWWLVDVSLNHQVDAQGRTALFMACACDAGQLERRARKETASQRRSRRYVTPCRRPRRMVLALLEAGARVDHVDAGGECALMMVGRDVGVVRP